MAGEERDYISWLHGQECACQPCASRDITASHPRTVRERASGKRMGGKPGKGQRSDDRRACPLCRHHHGQAQRYEFAKPHSYFFGMTKEQFAAWEREQGDKYFALYLAEQDSIAEGTATEKQTVSFLRRKGFDPVVFAARWCCAKALGYQLALDLGRDLKREMKEGGVPF